jgi:regulator of sirC expression with transglutaminase-like and TPR domain
VGTRSAAGVKEALEREEAQEGIGRLARLTADRTQRALRESKALKSVCALVARKGAWRVVTARGHDRGDEP